MRTFIKPEPGLSSEQRPFVPQPVLHSLGRHVPVLGRGVSQRTAEMEKDVLQILQSMRSEVMASSSSAASDEEVECGKCGKKVLLKIKLEASSSALVFNCEDCKIANRKAFAKALKRARPKAKKKAGTSQLSTKCPEKCPHCGKQVCANDSGETKYYCDDCGRLMFDPRSEQSLERPYKYKCEVCGVQFKWRTSLRRHSYIHTGEKNWKCNECGKRFRHKSTLTTHSMRHSGEKAYKCRFCEKSFVKGCDRQKHERVHTGEKPYSCQFCQKKFANISNCREHERNAWCYANPARKSRKKIPRQTK